MELEHLSQKTPCRVPHPRRYRRCHLAKLISVSLIEGEGVRAIIIFYSGDSSSNSNYTESDENEKGVGNSLRDRQKTLRRVHQSREIPN